MKDYILLHIRHKQTNQQKQSDAKKAIAKKIKAMIILKTSQTDETRYLLYGRKRREGSKTGKTTQKN